MSEMTAFDKEQINNMGFEFGFDFENNGDGSVNAFLYYPDTPANDPVEFDFNGSIEDFIDKFKGEIDRICADGYVKNVLADIEITPESTPEVYESNKASIESLRKNMCTTLAVLSIGKKGFEELSEEFDRIDITREEGSDRYIATLGINSYGPIEGIMFERSFSFNGTGKDFGAEMMARADSEMSMEYSKNKAVCDYIIGNVGDDVPDVSLALQTADDLAVQYTRSAHKIQDSIRETEYARKNNFVLTSKEIEKFEEKGDFDLSNPIGNRIEDAIDGMFSLIDNGDYFALSGYSPAGEDLEFEINFDGTLYDFARAVEEIADNFDIDEHAELWNGGNGAPDLSTLIEDAQDIKNELGFVSYNVGREVNSIFSEASKNDLADIRNEVARESAEKNQPEKAEKKHSEPSL